MLHSDRIRPMMFASLLPQLTLEEKAALCTGASAWTTTAIPRLNIPSVWVSDGPHGVRKVSDPMAVIAQSRVATAYPTASATACSWDVGLLRELGEALADEARALGVDMLLGPGVNMKRTPLCGRNFEYFSEDPVLTGNLAAALINGMQSRGVGASIKHFAANNQEFERDRISAVVDERALRELYLRAFEIAVTQAQPWTVMCAYNRLNGTYCSEHKQLLTDILRTEWGYTGLVMSDWGAVHNRPAGIAAGLDLEMPGPKPRRVQAVIDAVTSSGGDALPLADLDVCAGRVLQLVDRAHGPQRSNPAVPIDRHALARRIAAQSAVLLKNSGVLPLGPANPMHRVSSLAVIGHSAKVALYQGNGSSRINPSQVDVPFVELQKLLRDIETSYAEGCAADGSTTAEGIASAVALAHGADAAVLFVGLPGSKESEGFDRPDLDLTPGQVDLIRAVGAAQPRTVVVLTCGSAIAMSGWLDSVAAVLFIGFSGQAAGGALADVLCGRVNPGGKLAETFPLRLADTPAYINYPGENGTVRYGEGLFMGYRYYDSKDVPVQFPFGHGLSYTTFAYPHARLSQPLFSDAEGVDVSVDVTNTGAVAGSDVVQIYVHQHAPRLSRPRKELKAFAKVALAPGETRTVTVHLDARAFAYYDPAFAQWIAESGAYDVLIGASSTDIRATLTGTLQAVTDHHVPLNQESTIREWLAHPRGALVFGPMFEQMMRGLQTGLGAGEGGGDMLGMDFGAIIQGLPLRTMLGFQEAHLPQPPDVIVAGLLAQVR